MKKHLVLISVGLLNLLHGLVHIVQFIQSILLATYSMHGHEHSILHHPLFSLFWAVVGIATLVIGLKDYKHHKKCEH